MKTFTEEELIELYREFPELPPEHEPIDSEQSVPESTVRCAACSTYLTNDEVECYEDMCYLCVHDETSGLIDDDPDKELE